MTMLYLDLLETRANEALARKHEYERYVEIDASELLLLCMEIRHLRAREEEMVAKVLRLRERRP